MAVNVKLGVDTSSFRSGIQDANAQLKNFDAQLKLAETTMKATGNAESAMATKMQALNGKLTTQKQMVQQYEQQLKRLKDAGVDPLSREYQKLETQLLNTQASMMETEAALNGLDGSQLQAASSAEKLTQSMNGISKKISLDQVIGGINTITTGLENAAKKAVDLGQQLWNTIMDSARRADDTATMADMYGIDLQTFKQMQALFAGGMDTSVDSILTAMDKMKKGIGNGSSAVMDSLMEMGLYFKSYGGKGEGLGSEGFVTEDTLDLFFRAGQAIMAMGDSIEAEARQEATAQALFGRGWKDLKPLFEEYKDVDEYRKALENTTVSSEQATRDLAQLNDAVGALEQTWTSLKDEILGAIAPALTSGLEVVTGLLDSVMEYLKTDEGKTALEAMGKAVEGLFSDLSKIEPDKVVEGFMGVFDKIVTSLQWLNDNKQTIVDALKFIVASWAGLKLTGGALQILKLIDGARGLGLLGGGGSVVADAAGTTGGTAVAGGVKGFATSAMKTLPFALPFALGIDGIIQDQRKLAEARALGDMQLAAYTGKSAAYQGSELYNIWDEMTKFTTVAGGNEDGAKIEKFAQHYMDWFNDTVSDAALDQITEAMDQDAFDRFHDTMIGIMNGEHFYTEEGREDFLGAFNDAIAAAEKLMEENPPEFDIEPKVPENAAAIISGQVGDVPITFTVGDLKGKELLSLGFGPLKGHANGLPFVPYDGYLSILHRGERVLTASENRQYTYNNNNYFGNVNLNNGQDIDALVDSIDRRSRRKASGFGE